MKDVDCTTLRDEFKAGRVPSGPAVSSHLDGCVQCTELFRADARLGRSLAAGEELPLPELGPLWSGIEQRMQEESGVRAWLRSRSSRHRSAMAVAAIAALTAFGAVRLRADWQAYPRDRLLIGVGLLALTAVFCAASVLSSLGRPRPGRRWSLLVVGLGLALPLVIALLPPVSGAGGTGSGFWRSALSCSAYGLALALPLLALLWYLDRSELISGSRLLLAAAAGGLVANAALLLHCPIDHTGHLVLGHAGVGALLVAIGAAVLRARR